MKRINLIIFLFFYGIINVIGQYTVNTLNEYTTVNTKYTNFPVLQEDGVDLYSGRLKLSYNLLSSFAGDPLLKVFLSYNGGGVRVMEESGKVGLGWNIYNHPTISREVKGLSDIEAIDELNNNGYLNTNINLPAYSGFFSDSLQNAFSKNRFVLFTDLRNLGISNWDTQPDIFTLNLGDNTIKFVLPQRRGKNVLQAKLLNKEDKVKITFDWNNKTFNVLDEKGNKYIFDVIDYALSVSNNNSGQSAFPKVAIDDFVRRTTFENPIMTSWHVSKITKPNLENILFTYKLTNSGETPTISQSVSINACIAGSSNHQINQFVSSYSAYLTERQIHQLDKIQFTLGSLEFHYSDRLDLPICGLYPYRTNFSYFHKYGSLSLNDQKLDKIQLLDLSGKIIHQADFKYSYFNQNTTIPNYEREKSHYLRLKLDELKLDDEQFVFSYHKTDSLPSKLSNSIDYYGYNNGEQNLGRIPENNVDYYCSFDVHCSACTKNIRFSNFNNIFSNNYGIRSPKLSSGLIGSLVEVASNKGQRTKIEYELNSIFYNKNDSINTGYDFDSKSLKEYVALYESTVVQTEVFQIDPASSYNPQIILERICGGDFNNPEGASHYLCTINYQDLQKVAFEVVNASTGVIAKTFYHSNIESTGITSLPKGSYFIRFRSLHEPWNVIYNPGAPDNNKIYYFATKVTIKESTLEMNGGWLNVNIGGLRVKSLDYYDKTIKQFGKKYDYNQFNSNRSSGKLSHPYINYKDDIVERIELPSNNFCLALASLYKSVIFSSDPTIYIPNEQAIVGYTNVRESIVDNQSLDQGHTDHVFFNIKNEYAKTSAGSHNHLFPGNTSDPFQLWYNYFPIKSFFHINGKPKTEITYDKQHKRVKQVNYSYENDDYNYSKVILNGGIVRGSSFEELDCRGYAVSHTSLTSYQPYVIYDMTNPLLKKVSKEFNLGTIQTEESWSYRLPSYNLESQTIKGSDNNDQIFKYIYPGDPESMGMNYINMLLEKNIVNQPLVTTIYNAGKEISKSSFTYGLFHNKYLLPAVETHYSKGNTISKQFTFNYNALNGSIESVQKPTSPMIIYIWGYGGQYPIAEITNANYAEIEKVLTKATVDNLNSPQVTEEVVTAAINKLRTAPSLSKAMITSYTYQSLVGMKSKTDSRGVTEYYEYDGMQRLKAILDHLKYVNRSFIYHYRSN